MVIGFHFIKALMMSHNFKMFILLFFCIIIVVQNLELIPLKHEIKYYNPKYVKDPVIHIGRKGRGSPYYFSMYAEIAHVWGNNITVGFKSFEYLGGNYVPLLLNMEFELCKFYQEPILGKMIVAQLPKNLSTCPVPPGFYALPDLVMHLENFPINIPFTYDPVQVSGRVDVKGHITATKELVFDGSVHGRAIQKPRHKL